MRPLLFTKPGAIECRHIKPGEQRFRAELNTPDGGIIASHAITVTIPMIVKDRVLPDTVITSGPDDPTPSLQLRSGSRSGGGCNVEC